MQAHSTTRTKHCSRLLCAYLGISRCINHFRMFSPSSLRPNVLRLAIFRYHCLSMASAPFICGRCTRAIRSRALPLAAPSQLRRHVSRSRPLSLPAADATNPLRPNLTKHAPSSHPSGSLQPADPSPEPEPGPMTRRLEQATEDALLTGGRAGRRAIEEAGFDEELKAKLLDKVASAKFNAEYSSAASQAGITSRIPDSAGLGTRTIASSRAWEGEETTEDAILRMLDDAKKQLAPGLRGKSRMPDLKPVDMRLRREVSVSLGQRAAGARDKAHAYAGMGMKDSGLSEEEREAVKREFRERFTPGARAMPNTVSGLAALANERIEDAIARGQFKNIPRGKGVERDTRADNPFIDTVSRMPLTLRHDSVSSNHPVPRRSTS